jgi:hypothetical protein
MFVVGYKWCFTAQHEASGPKSARALLRSIVERHWRQADVVKDAGGVKQCCFRRTLDGHIAKTQNSPSHNAFAGGSDSNCARRDRSSWWMQRLPWPRKLIRVCAKRDEFNSWCKRIGKSIKFAQTSFLWSDRQPELICKQNETRLDPKRIRCYESGRSHADRKLLPKLVRIFPLHNNLKSGFSSITEPAYSAGDIGESSAFEAKIF